VTLGLVNGAIGIVCSVQYSIDQPNTVDSITIKFHDRVEHHLEQVNSKFQLLERTYVIRNIDPRSIKALDSAIIEYSQLQQKFSPSLSPLSTSKQRPKSVSDRCWCITKSSLAVQQKSISANLPAAFPNKGFSNTD